MIRITEEYVDAAAPNTNAITKGWDLVNKRYFVKLFKSEDETLIFGECKGSGRSNYFPSADFLKPESPVFRCTCPSRQFPCKHCLGLLYAFAAGKTFTGADIPRDILEKRKKTAARAERKKRITQPGKKKTDKSALKKKIKSQLEGLELLGSITANIVKNGFASLDPRTLQTLEKQAKELGNYYLPGAQTALRRFLLLFKNNEKWENIYTDALIQIGTLHALEKKGKEYLTNRLKDPELKMDADSTIDEWLGHALQLTELKAMGLVQSNVELIQLYFNSYIDEARKEFVDLGLWINLKTGQIQETRNYRPFRAAKHIKEDDSFFSVISTKELYVYPGDYNPRIRWEEKTVRDIKPGDYIKILSLAVESFPGLVKTVKDRLKNPLSDKNPAALVKYSLIGKLGKHLMAEDKEGERLVLEDMSGEPPTCYMIHSIPRKDLENRALLVRFFHNMDSGNLRVQPLAIVTDRKILRFAY